MAADKEGFRVRFHAIGDGAVRLALDALGEAEVQNGKEMQGTQLSMLK